jgi:hypothetical protein
MDKIKPLFTATATATGGRNGHTESSDGVVAADLSVPKEMGGAGKPGTATPEHLFAAGYAACFGALSTSSASSIDRMRARRGGERLSPLLHNGSLNIGNIAESEFEDGALRVSDGAVYIDKLFTRRRDFSGTSPH